MPAATTLITSEMASQVTDIVTANVGVVLPAAFAVMAIFVGIRAVPRIIHMFI